MPNSDENVCAAKLKVLQLKQNSIFARITELSDMCKKLSGAVDTRKVDEFLNASFNIEKLYSDFSTVVDEGNEMSMLADDKYVPNYQSWMAVESLVSVIQQTRANILESRKGGPSSSEKRSNANVEHNIKIKLPPLEIISFNGSQEMWPLFFESFKVNVHNNKLLDNSQKVQYLVSKLKDRALSVISGIIPNGGNYDVIWQSLVDKYQDVRSLGTTYLNNIFDCVYKPNDNKSLSNFVDTMASSISALKQLKIDDVPGFIFTHIILKKLDKHTVNMFEQSVREKKIATYEDLLLFLKHQVKIGDRISECFSETSSLAQLSRPKSDKFKNKTYPTSTFLVANNSESSKRQCLCCRKSDHNDLVTCTKFKNMSVQDRFQLIKRNKSCICCLKSNHTVSKCQNDGKLCRVCQEKHHELLHFSNKKSGEKSSSVLTTSAPAGHVTQKDGTSVTLHSSASVLNLSKTVVLSTAQVSAIGSSGKRATIRCLVDSASQNHLISMSCCKKLGLELQSVHNTSLKTVGSVQTPILGKVSLKIKSLVSTHTYNIVLFVVQKIVDKLPVERIDVSELGYLSQLPLADEQWSTPGEVEVILGAQLFPMLLLGNDSVSQSVQNENNTGRPFALNTTLGYIVMGEAPIAAFENNAWSFGPLLSDDLSECLTRFWKLEEIPGQYFSSEEDLFCESIYKSDMMRDAEGRYIVPLIFKDSPDKLGNSYSVAKRRLFTLERRLRVDPELRTAYNQVILDYLDKGYLSEVVYDSETNHTGYIIPHHPVVKPSSLTTKTRVVLDASCKTDSGVSLNDILHTGPNLQADLFTLMLKFRLFPIALSADIQQMYLRILIKDEHKHYQKILFRFSDTDPIKSFCFNSVAFGLRCSPFLAMRTIKQLAADEKLKYNRAAMVAESELYMDDLTTSVHSIEEGKSLVRELRGLFELGGFDLVKWSSNSKEVLETVPEASQAQIEFDDVCSSLKILGMKWVPVSDHFTYTVSSSNTERCTKRFMLSTIARLFDVLGLVSPVLLYAKMLIQELWLSKIDWDDEPPVEISDRFECLRRELPLLSSLTVPRHVGVQLGVQVSILGFADASTKAYGGVIYLRVVTVEGKVSMHLVCAKSKVAPIKTVSLARLELCAALLLAQLMHSVIEAYRPEYLIEKIYAFTDSSIVLSWVHASPHRFKTFVANRISRILDYLPSECFFHVAGDQNPCDVLSRGLLPSQLLSCELWWNGPTWACQSVDSWPIRSISSFCDRNLSELKMSEMVTAATHIIENTETPLLLLLAERFSSWSKLLRAVVYIYRFLKVIPRNEFITASNLDFAQTKLILELQSHYFKEDIGKIKLGKQCSRSLQKLKPFLQDGILRVGGRLGNSNLNFDQQHPIVLPRKDHIVNLIVDYYHKVYCHAGPDLLLSILRQKFWIFAARNVVRCRIHKCLPCYKIKPAATYPEMADLRACRVIENIKPFVHVATDFAGPFKVSVIRGRGMRSHKSYICVFVCLTTRALHLELATELSTPCFMSALKRFLARRGAVSHMYSDNGTNYVGAKNYLNEMHNLLTSKDYQGEWSNILAENRITWHLNPPAAPHFNGIAESAVKSVKTHLLRVVGEQILSMEEMSTLLTQVEAVLNSRPLCSTLTTDPSEPAALTPAHFLHVSPLKTLPALEITEDRLGLLARHSLIDKLLQSFWKRWKNEYLHSLQIRNKWFVPSNPISVGTVVIVSSDNAPPLHWPLGIIEEVHPGVDGVVRVAKVRTSTGTYVRPVTRLCPLPSQE